MKNIFVLIILSVLFFSACEQEITIDLPQPEATMVVEGWIENDEYPVVVLTRNSSYFDPIDSTYLVDSLFITDAIVVVSNGILEDTLQLVVDFNNLMTNTWPYVYYKGSKFTGIVNGSYSLRIEAEGKVITGFTTIPQPHGFDTLWWEPDEPEYDTLGYIWATFSDPPAEKNYYRIFTRRLGRDGGDIPLFGSVYDDVYFAGESITFSFFRGISSIEDDSAYADEEFGYWKKGDTVIVRVSTMDVAHYDFWTSAEQEMFSGGNPFANPTTIRHNVQGAVGVFGGYGSVYDTLIIQ
ncbi:MAG: hypothetical protein C0592_02650 [Marinilabiliales bacterium]|nr:MAG: hypothetical protein C0592_02650 [Marinilabiliales bacterium]